MSTKSNTVREKKPRRNFPAKTKCEAVLSVWTEQRKPAEVCRELGVSWQQLMNWQKQAMKAMLARLEPPSPETPKRALSRQVKRLLEEAESKSTKRGKLDNRLQNILKNQAEASEG